MPRTYDDEINDIAKIMRSMNKEAQEQRPIVDPQKTDKARTMPGKSAPKEQETNEAIAGTPEDTLQDNENKSVENDVSGEAGTKHENASNKLAKASRTGDVLLSQIYRELQKNAQEGNKSKMGSKQKGAKVKSCQDEEVAEESVPSEEELAQEIEQELADQSEQEPTEEEVDVEEDPETDLTEEERAELAEKPASLKRIIGKMAMKMSKKAGVNVMNDLMKSGTFEKIALAIYAPKIEEVMQKSASAQDVDEDALMKTAAYIAGQMTSEFMDASGIGQQNNEEIVKKAYFIAAEKANNVINEEKGKLNKTAELLAAAKLTKLAKEGKIKFVNPQ